MLEIANLVYSHTNTSAGEVSQTFHYDLGIDRGQIAGVTGRSGSGKSTLLDLIAGFLSADTGDIRIDGNSVLGLPPDLRPLTILFQNNNLFDHLSVTDNIGLGINPALRLSTDQWKAVSEAIERVGLKGKENARAQRLSGGEQQRAALARSLVRQRPVLLLDEPFSALDGETRREMLKLVREITDAHRLSVLLITHDPTDCDAIADRHYVMSEGRLNRKR